MTPATITLHGRDQGLQLEMLFLTDGQAIEISDHQPWSSCMVEGVMIRWPMGVPLIERNWEDGDGGKG